VIQGRLPLPWTVFVGREREQASLRRLLTRARLVTVVGLPGVGKTRLALQVTEALRSQPEAEVWFASGEGLTDPDQLLPPLSAAAGLSASDVQPWEEMIPRLADRRALLFLDGVEGLLPARLGEVLTRWLAWAPGVSVLLTSLRPTGLPGEHLLSLRPMLPIPDLEEDQATERWREVDAIRLFEARAQQRDCEWQLTEENLPVVRELCMEMDWLPMGIELAAEQLAPWNEAGLLEQLRGRGHHLDLAASATTARHNSLRQAVDWNWSLLTAAEQELLLSLAALGGELFEEALEPLTANPGASGVAAGLYRMGLLLGDHAGGRLRYRMPATIRRYALEQQREQGEDLAGICRFYLELTRREGERLGGARAAESAAVLRLELPALERCWQWARQQDDQELLRGLALALWDPLLRELELPPSAWELAKAAAACVDPTPDGARLLCIAGALAARLGTADEALTCLRHCLEIGAAEPVRAVALAELARVYLQQGQPLAARDTLQQSLALLAPLGCEEEAAWVRRLMVAACERLGDREGAERHAQEAWLQFRELEVLSGQAGASVDLARLAADRGRWDVAEARGEEAVQRYHELGHAGGQGGALVQLARARARRGERELGKQLYAQALTRLRAIGAAGDICHALLLAAAEPDAAAQPMDPVRAYRECIALARERGLRSFLAHALHGLAQTYAAAGRDERALAIAQEAVQVARETTETPLIQACLDLLGRLESPSAVAGPRSASSIESGVRVQTLTIRERELLVAPVPAAAASADDAARSAAASRWPPAASASAIVRVEVPGPLRVRLLGGLSLSLGDRDVPLLDWWAKAKKLFAYLVIHQGRPVSRDILLDEFWPEGDQQRAVHSLQTTLSFIRRSLRSLPGGPLMADRLIVARDGNYLFDGEGRCESDVQLFTARRQEGARLKAAGHPDAAAAQWQEADRLYAGDLLPDFPYDDWCTSPRERLRSQYMELLLELARYLRQAQRLREALHTTERMFLIDGCDERAHRMAMRCHVQLGRPVEALRQFERCCQILERELRVRPSKATQDLHELIRQRMSCAPAPGAGAGDGALAAGPG
jgi:DNA-binding SARP family transcriptional activator/predicted ATPase